MKQLAVIFPGIGYHVDKPLLYYSKRLATEHGFLEVLNISYTYKGQNIRGNYELMKEAENVLYTQAKAQLIDVDWGAYNRILFISKSIGTAIALRISEDIFRENGKLPELKSKIFHILFTPLNQTFEYSVSNAISFIGDADQWSDVPKLISQIQLCNIKNHIFKDCNHSLECASVTRNLLIINDVIKLCDEWLNEVTSSEGRIYDLYST